MEGLVGQKCNLSDILDSDVFLAKSSQSNIDYTQVEKSDGGEYYNQHVQGIWFVTWFMLVEYAALFIQGESLPDLHHNLLSLCHAIFYQISRILFRGFEFACYVWVWKNYALFSLSSDSAITVVAVALGTDFAYYWLHRASHEIAIFWAIHQVHHSSDDITVTIGLRHSPLQRLFVWVFYLPLAVLGVPPAHMIAQEHFNKMYQCWIHTTAINKLGPLEYIFNTPNHHRVHHGSNTEYLDTNYGGIFIIWDRMFGTFKAENPGVKTVYNLLVVPKFLEMIHNQIFYVQYLMEKAAEMDNWVDYISTFIKGPSWSPGSSWTGVVDISRQVDPNRPRHEVHCGWILHVYTFSHFFSALILTTYLDVPKADGFLGVLVYCGMIIATLSSIGQLYDNAAHARHFEVFRCFLVICLQVLLPVGLPEFVDSLIFYHHVLSATFWVCLPKHMEI